ncbi:MAG: sensor histidine kinase, partial [Sphingobacteriales bacterium]
MKTEGNTGYRKNFLLVVTFIALISFFFILSLFLAFNFSKKFVENEFASEKVTVLERTIKPYNDFFQNKLPEISFYNGFLDSTTAANFIDTVLQKYAFVKRVTFYDAEVKNTPVADGISLGNYNFGPKAAYQYGRDVPKDSTVLAIVGGEDFRELAVKLTNYIERLDTTTTAPQDELFSEFSNVRRNKITYLNIPQPEDLKTYYKLVRKENIPPIIFQQDMLSFQLDPNKIAILNPKPL